MLLPIGARPHREQHQRSCKWQADENNPEHGAHGCTKRETWITRAIL